MHPLTKLESRVIHLLLDGHKTEAIARITGRAPCVIKTTYARLRRNLRIPKLCTREVESGNFLNLQGVKESWKIFLTIPARSAKVGAL